MSETHAEPITSADLIDLLGTLPAEESLLRLSKHAVRRAARRNLAATQVAYVLAHGRRMHRTGVTFYFLARRAIPPRDQRNAALTRLVGTVVIVGRNGEVVTVYRNARAWHDIARKMKYRLNPEQLGEHIVDLGSTASDACAEHHEEAMEEWSA